MTNAADGRRVRGDLTRRRVLDEAVQRASTDGLSGVSIGALAQAVEMSKSGLVGLFGSKEGLQLATLDHARDVFVATVVVPAEPGLTPIGRLSLTLGRWLDHSQDRVFAGGCFFQAVSAELDSRPGVLRDRARVHIAAWSDYLGRLAGRAVDERQLHADTDIDQLLFEVEAFYAQANDASLLNDDDDVYRRARVAMRSALVVAGADPGEVRGLDSIDAD